MYRFVCLLLCALWLGFAAPLTVTNAEAATEQAAVATLNVNTASAQDLQVLPGIGQKTAGNIITYRDDHGAFTSVDHLIRVKGIGPKTLEKIRNLVSVK